MSPKVAAIAAILFLLCSLPMLAQFGGAAGERSLSRNPVEHDGWSMRTGSLSGTVRTIDNQPLSGIRIELHEVTSGDAVYAAFTNKSGSFEFDDVPRGTYEVLAISGISEARERVELNMGDYTVRLRMRTAVPSGDGADTVSVAEMKVPGKARSMLHKAQDELQKDKTVEARQDAQRAIEIYPNYAAAHATLGMIALQEQKPDDATAELERSVKLDPNSPTAYLALGAAYNLMGRYDDALRALASADRLSPNTWQGSFEQSKSYLAKGEYSSALHYVEQAARLAPRLFAPIHLIKAHALLGLKDYPEAVTELQQYLQHEPPQSPDAAEARQTLDEAKAFTDGKK